MLYIAELLKQIRPRYAVRCCSFKQVAIARTPGPQATPVCSCFANCCTLNVTAIQLIAGKRAAALEHTARHEVVLWLDG